MPSKQPRIDPTKAVMFPEFDNSFSSLPNTFYQSINPAIPGDPTLLGFNKELAESLGFKTNAISTEDIVNNFSGAQLPSGAKPIALAYAGHQFGHFTPQLGDGRAVLLGEILTPDNNRFDIQLKGSGKTRFSRGGDGLSAIGPVIREYIVSEAMHHLGVNTTRALAAVSTGDTVYRESRLPGAVLTRIASSHIRIGTFQFHSAQGDHAAIRTLADYVIKRHYPKALESENPYLSFFDQVLQAQASLISHWMSIGFIHGVMNTDNTSISGETIDYGPCAFMDDFHFQKVFSSIDQNGRYAYINQAAIGHWNLARLADCLVSLIDTDAESAIHALESSLDKYGEQFQSNWLTKIAKKLGIEEPNQQDEQLIRSFMEYLDKHHLDFTLSFRSLSEILHNSNSDAFVDTEQFHQFKAHWLERLNKQDISLEQASLNMNRVNPLYIARNHQVERAIQGSISGDLTIFHELNTVLKNPFTHQPQFEQYALAPIPEERINATFCGT